MITSETSREDLLAAVYSELELVGAFVEANLDPEEMDTAAVYEFVQAWVQEGDECAQA